MSASKAGLMKGPRGRCKATNRQGGRCQTTVAVGAVCWRHGAASLRGPLALTFDHGMPLIWPCEKNGELGEKTTPDRVRTASSWAAAELIKRGVIIRGYFLQRGNRRFLARLEREGVRVVVVTTNSLVHVVHFHVAGHCARPEPCDATLRARTPSGNEESMR
jgi:hypothetical protein